MLRYTVLRILVFFAVLALLWLLGLRGEENLLFLVVGAALISSLVSLFALRRFREDTSARIAERIETRAEARAASVPRVSEDDEAEDAEVEERSGVRPEERDGGDFR
jgi:hypothetical protein